MVRENRITRVVGGVILIYQVSIKRGVRCDGEGEGSIGEGGTDEGNLSHTRNIKFPLKSSRDFLSQYCSTLTTNEPHPLQWPDFVPLH